MYHLNAAFEFACQPPNRLLFAGPSGEFIVTDTSGLIKRVLEAIAAEAPLEPIFSVLESTDQRAIAQERILAMLRTRGIIKAKPENVRAIQKEAPRDVLCDWLGFVGTVPQDVQIEIIGDSALSGLVTDALSELGFNASANEAATQPFATVLVYCQDKPDRTALRAANALAIARQSSFFPIALDRHIISLGPFIVPGATACVECLHHREAMNRASPDAEIGKHLSPAPSQFTARLAALIGVETLVRFLFGAAQDMHMASITRHSVLTGNSVTSTILKLPRCPACSGPALRKPLMSSFSQGDLNVMQAAE